MSADNPRELAHWQQVPNQATDPPQVLQRGPPGQDRRADRPRANDATRWLCDARP